MNEKKAINVRISANIRREREKAGYTQEQFSEMIGIGTKSLSAAERGTVGVSLTTLCKICQVLSLSSNALLFDTTPNLDAQNLAEQLSSLTPEQFAIASRILQQLMAAFKLGEQS